MERVHAFAVDKAMRDEVKEYIIDHLKQTIIDRTFAGYDVAGYAEAKSIIESCFAKMNTEFGGQIEKQYINEQE